MKQTVWAVLRSICAVVVLTACVYCWSFSPSAVAITVNPTGTLSAVVSPSLKQPTTVTFGQFSIQTSATSTTTTTAGYPSEVSGPADPAALAIASGPKTIDAM